MPGFRPDFFLLVDLQELFIYLGLGGGGGGGGGRKKSSEIFRAFFFFKYLHNQLN